MKNLFLICLLALPLTAKADTYSTPCEEAALQAALNQALNDAADPEEAPREAVIAQTLQREKLFVVHVSGGRDYQVSTGATATACSAIEVTEFKSRPM